MVCIICSWPVPPRRGQWRRFQHSQPKRTPSGRFRHRSLSWSLLLPKSAGRKQNERTQGNLRMLCTFFELNFAILDENHFVVTDTNLGNCSIDTSESISTAAVLEEENRETVCTAATTRSCTGTRSPLRSRLILSIALWYKVRYYLCLSFSTLSILCRNVACLPQLAVPHLAQQVDNAERSAAQRTTADVCSLCRSFLLIVSQSTLTRLRQKQGRVCYCTKLAPCIVPTGFYAFRLCMNLAFNQVTVPPLRSPRIP